MKEKDVKVFPINITDNLFLILKKLDIRLGETVRNIVENILNDAFIGKIEEIVREINGHENMSKSMPLKYEKNILKRLFKEYNLDTNYINFIYSSNFYSTTVRINKELFSKIEDISKRIGLPKSSIIRIGLIYYVKLLELGRYNSHSSQ